MMSDYIQHETRADFFVDALREKRSYLLEVQIELTADCNCACSHCYISPEPQKCFQDLPLAFDEIRSLADESANLGCLSWRLTGGEPLIRPDFPQIFLYLCGKGIQVTIFTNGTLITKDLVVMWSRIPPYDLEVSIYGATRSTHDRITGRDGSYDMLQNGIRLLREHAVPFVLSSTIHQKNVHELCDMERMAREMTGRTLKLNTKLCLSGWRNDKRNKAISALRILPQEVVEIEMRRALAHKNPVHSFLRQFHGSHRGNKIFSCGAGCGFIFINARGQLQACTLVRAPDCLYDIRKGSLDDALRNFLPQLRTMKSSNNGWLNRCSRCWLSDFCDSCPGWSWMEHGVLDQPVDYLCDIAHAEVQRHGILSPSQKAWLAPLPSALMETEGRHEPA